MIQKYFGVKITKLNLKNIRTSVFLDSYKVMFQKVCNWDAMI